MASPESKSSATEDFSAIFSEKLIGELGAKALDFGLRLVFALVVIFIGLIIIKFICWVVGKILQRKKMDATIKGFLLSLLKGILKIVLLTIVMDILGMEVVSFVALIGALGLAVGLSLGNIASNAVAGFFILINKPFVVGEYVEAAGVSGTVFLIEIFATTLLTPDRKTVIVPNAEITGGHLTNYSREELRRVDLTLGVSYNDDIEKTKAVVASVVNSCQHALKEPAPTIRCNEHGASSVNFVVRVWAKNADYWSVFFYLQENLKHACDANGLEIPFPQVDVHLIEEEHAPRAGNDHGDDDVDQDDESEGSEDSEEREKRLKKEKKDKKKEKKDKKDKKSKK